MKRTYKLDIVSPINKSSSITVAGTVEKMTVRLQVPQDSIKNAVDGMALTPGSQLAIVVTDPAQFDVFKPGGTVSITLEA